MAVGIIRHGNGPPVDESPLEDFIRTLSQLPAEEWQKRIAALEALVKSIPDHSTSANAEDGDLGVAFPVTPSSAPRENSGVSVAAANNSNVVVPWYRSSRSVRKLSPPLKNLILDARSAVVKEATELIGTLMIVKLQPLPAAVEAIGGEGVGGDNKVGSDDDDALKTPSKSKSNDQAPPAFVGRLLFKDLIVPVLQLSAQTVKVIRSYGVSMMLDIIPHCRVKSSLVILSEKMRSDKNRSVREDCARYLRCVLETWPWDDESSQRNVNITSRKEERLSVDSARQVGNGLGRALSDPAQPVRNEAKRGFQVLFQRFRSVWNEVMRAGVIRDVRLRKTLLEAAAKADGGNIFEDIASLDDMSLNSLGQGSFASMRSGTSYRSYASRGMSVRSNQPGGGGGHHHVIPSVIGTPQQRPKPSYGLSDSSPSYLKGTAASSTRIAEREKYGSSPSPAKAAHDYSANVYVTTTGQVMATPSPRAKFHKPTPIGDDGEGNRTTQPFASLLRTPQHPRSSSRKTTAYSSGATPSRGHHSREYNQKSSKVLRKRLSCRITGITPVVSSLDDDWNNLSRINESDDNCAQTNNEDGNGAEIAAVAMEVLAAHLSHLEEMEAEVAKEKKILLDLGKQFGILDIEGLKSSHFHGHLATLSEEQVCDYFESVHVCADQQRIASEKLLKEMENISKGGEPCKNVVNTVEKRELAQSPMNGFHLDTVQKELDDLFDD
mmetsp:Transcript_3387/g.7151  ORF Transcript_3387/g.7151 Transcript_3387/m.7151 type:complete len:720 (-) Transcript_3387:81-2240(-)|eukprot:CAMPEP_0171338816 /NCGR_PEP_ID=MMETSP0878-20121228/7558_1 /TAXON_ID=67004 /ORGANISM="Thalassiosira weissflogii, Strain CCMP1336" /LENGTH=719 /DNA_ID=CAMNT_0011840637 /DNA_START=102 /DNA_END=2261 /DNA_ORIENTATION=+